MKKLAFSALLLGALGLAACGGDDGDDNGNGNGNGNGGGDGGVIIPDAGGDAGGGACSPTEQTGCEAGQKCAQLVTRADDPATPNDEFLGRTACVPNGDVGAGEACTQGEAGEETGFDNCEAGLACNGVCVAICTSDPQDGCGTDETCVLFYNTFDDVGNTGLCAPACDPVTQTLTVGGVGGDEACPDRETTTGTRTGACFLNRGLNVTSCSTVPPEAEGLTMGKECYGPPGSNQCYLNGCAKGYTPIWLSEPGNQNSAVTCSAYCAHVDTYLEGDTVVGDAEGDANSVDCTGATVVGGSGAPYSCRSAQYLSNTDDPATYPYVPAAWGICAAALQGLGDCTGFDKEAFITALTDPDGAGPEEAPNDLYCILNPGEPEADWEWNYDLCPQGCVSEETLNSWFPEATSQAVARKLAIPVITEKGMMVGGKFLVEAPQ